MGKEVCVTISYLLAWGTGFAMCTTNSLVITAIIAVIGYAAYKLLIRKIV